MKYSYGNFEQQMVDKHCTLRFGIRSTCSVCAVGSLSVDDSHTNMHSQILQHKLKFRFEIFLLSWLCCLNASNEAL